ncbi:3-ketosteroid reductase [Rasamsonia emersonii CBS 393.64]|uniref:3-ketosteroid reductase n=1 Tax=Rasamsonia emersonii (strain ATCC 16479 / CBS 393.64 / IMI 116815) TaxID=1408163 RepID=A0A0F4YVU4_RASE3|nr:3-ketosteroid reductase [Rasamsonia emersonii CBS 393.64]KKA21733.1 3-ketosteroid reductase [Rasamsonia emersonii CBS 393.64]
MFFILLKLWEFCLVASHEDIYSPGSIMFDLSSATSITPGMASDLPAPAMFSIDPPDKLENNVVVLVTGANTGLGLSTCCRLIDEFLHSHPVSHRLTVIFTTRNSPQKIKDTYAHLRNHLARHDKGDSKNASQRVRLLSETVDLANLKSVRALSRRLNKNIPKLDAVILNAGIGGWSGLNWPLAVWCNLTDVVNATTWPVYKLSYVGMLTEKQTRLPEESPLGAVFCANVFGHYMLAHNLMPLLRRSGQPNGPGRVIWISSVEATIKLFDVDDIQGLKSTKAYESSKSLMDLLALTSDLPSTAPWVNSFLSTSDSDQSAEPCHGPPPKIYVSHPGIFGTSIVPLPLPLFWGMIGAFFLARWLGSPWHTIWTYLAASAPVWLALSPQSVLDEAEAPYRQNGGGLVKWGSSCDRLGRDRPASTEVDGWGYGGVVGGAILEEDARRRRKRGAKDLTAEDKARFEELGRRCWQEMEQLRIEWEKLLDKDEAAAGADK